MFKPRHGLVLIEPTARQEKTEGGIILPENHKQSFREAIVVAIGPGRILESGATAQPTDITVGSRVMFKAGNGLDLKDDGRDCVLLNNEDIIGILA